MTTTVNDREHAHAELIRLRPDLSPHADGCEDPECVAACEVGRCTCAGCPVYLDDAEEAMRERRNGEEQDEHDDDAEDDEDVARERAEDRAWEDYLRAEERAEQDARGGLCRSALDGGPSAFVALADVLADADVLAVVETHEDHEHAQSDDGACVAADLDVTIDRPGAHRQTWRWSVSGGRVRRVQ